MPEVCVCVGVYIQFRWLIGLLQKLKNGLVWPLREVLLLCHFFCVCEHFQFYCYKVAENYFLCIFESLILTLIFFTRREISS